MCIQEELKICKFPLKTSVQNFLAKLCNLLSFGKGFPNGYKMLKSNEAGSRSKYRFSLV